MNEHGEEHSRTLRWILSLPGVPRPLIAALFALCWFYLYLGTYLESLAKPGQVWWLNIWDGAFGGNGFSAFGATVLAIILTSEVIFMVLTLLGNRRRVIDAARKAAEEAAGKAAKEGREERDKVWQEWYEAVKTDLEAGRPPSIEPPINGKHNGSTPE